MSASALISNIALHSLACVSCVSRIPLLFPSSRARARSRHERISIRVASRAGTDCHRPFHVVLLILDQRSRREKKTAQQQSTHQSQCGTNAAPAPVTNIDIALPMRDISRYIFNSLSAFRLYSFRNSLHYTFNHAAFILTAERSSVPRLDTMSITIGKP